MTLADYLRERRRKKGQSQRAAAAEVGVTRQTWIKWEQGQTPVAERLVRLAEWAGCSMNQLKPYLGGNGNE